MVSVFKKTDIAVIAVLLVVAALLALNSGRVFFGASEYGAESGASVVIRCNGEVFATVPLDESSELAVTAPSGAVLNVVTIENGRVAVSYATCSDLLCEWQGGIQSAGGMIVCLPNRVTVEITSQVSLNANEGEPPFDAVLR